MSLVASGGQVSLLVPAKLLNAGYAAAMTEEREPARAAKRYELGRYPVLRSSGLAGVTEPLEAG